MTERKPLETPWIEVGGTGECRVVGYRWTPAALRPSTWWLVDGAGEPVDMLFDHAPYATPEAIAAFPPPALAAAYEGEP